MTTSWLTSPLWHLGCTGENLFTLQKLSRSSRCRYYSIMICLRLNDGLNPEFRCAILRISFMEVVGCILLSQLCQFVKFHLLLPTPFHALLYCCGDCAHHPAGFVIFPQLALLYLLIIFIFPINPIVRTSKTTQSVSDSSRHLGNRLFRLSVRQSRNFRILHIVLLLLNRCLGLFNSLSCHRGLSLNIILNPFLFLFIVSEVCFLSFLKRKLFFVSQAAQCPKGSDCI
jgi:hypothetical protein